MPNVLYQFLAKGPIQQELVSTREKLRHLSLDIDFMSTYKSTRPISYFILRSVHKISKGNHGCSSLKEFIEAKQALQKKEHELNQGLDTQVLSKIKKAAISVGLLFAGSVGLYCAVPFLSNFMQQQKHPDPEPQSEPPSSAPLMEAVINTPPDRAPYDESLRGDLIHCPRSVLLELILADQHQESPLFWQALSSNGRERKEVCEKLLTAAIEPKGLLSSPSKAMAQRAIEIFSSACGGDLLDQNRLALLQEKIKKRPIAADELIQEDVDQIEQEYSNQEKQRIVITDYEHRHLSQRIILAFSKNQLSQFFHLAAESSHLLLFLKRLYNQGWHAKDFMEGYLANNNRAMLEIVNSYATGLFESHWIKWRDLYHKPV